MTKAELIKALELYDNDTQIFIRHCVFDDGCCDYIKDIVVGYFPKTFPDNKCVQLRRRNTHIGDPPDPETMIQKQISLPEKLDQQIKQRAKLLQEPVDENRLLQGKTIKMKINIFEGSRRVVRLFEIVWVISCILMGVVFNDPYIDIY
jgi:hypothetical protein